jgi:hypothetical protein
MAHFRFDHGLANAYRGHFARISLDTLGNPERS